MDHCSYPFIAIVAASAGQFLDGLLGNEPRKTGWMRAEAAGDPGPWHQQAILVMCSVLGASSSLSPAPPPRSRRAFPRRPGAACRPAKEPKVRAGTIGPI